MAVSDATTGSTLKPVRNLMSSMAWRFVGSAIATMSEEPARDTGMILCLLAHLLRDELEDVLIDLVLVEVDRGNAILRREEVGDLAVGDVAELRERRAEVLARSLLLVLRLAKLLRG